MSNETKPVTEVAVIIPCYNSASSLARALDSALAQTHRDFRIYVIDDGSTDDTAAVLPSYSDRVITVPQPHSGQAAARNHGIRISSSPYIAFLDADDEWLPTKLERQLEILKGDPRIGMIYSDCLTSGTGPFAGSHFARVGPPASGRVFVPFLSSCNVFTPTVMVRRECLNDVGLFNESLPVCEDFNLWLRIAARWQVAVIPEALAIRHLQPGSLSRTTDVDLAVSSSIASFKHVLQASPNLPENERAALRKTIANRHYEYGAYLIQNGKPGPCRQQMFEAIRWGRFDWRVAARIVLSFLPRRVASLKRTPAQLKDARG